MLQDGKTIFNSLAAQYDAYRPHYPPEALLFLVTLAELDSDSDVADVGTGTGRIAIELAKYVRIVYGIDTASAMLERLIESAQEEWLGNIRTIEAPGEDTTLPDESVDLAVLAQSFHWMEKSSVLREMHRILNPNKPMVILWNQTTNTADQYYKEIIALIEEYNPDYIGASDIVSTDFQSSIDASKLFGPVEKFSFPFTLHYTAESYIGFLLSKSYIGVGIPQAKLGDFIENVHQHLRDNFPHGNVEEHYETVILAAKKS